MTPNRLGSRGVVAVAFVLGLVGGAALLASEVIERETLGVDYAILKAMRDASGDPIGPAWFQRAMIDISAMGSTVVVTMVVIVTAISLVLARRRRHALVLALCGVGTAIGIVALKALVGRSRPDVIQALDDPGGFSFPSGHTLTASAIYPLIGFLVADFLTAVRYRALVLTVAVFIAIAVGFSRIYLGVHYPTDVVAGWSLGLAWAVTCGFIGSRFVPGVEYSSS